MVSNSRRQHQTSFVLENLDERLAPSSISGLAQLAHLHAKAAARYHRIVARQKAARLHQSKAQAPTYQTGSSNAGMTVAIPGLRTTGAAAVGPVVAPIAISQGQAVPVAAAASPPQMFVAPSLEKAGVMLSQLYQEYQTFVASGQAGEFQSRLAGQLRIQGDKVGIDLQTSGDLAAYVSKLQTLGMQVETTNATVRMVEGLLPISAIPDATNLPETSSVSPIYRPVMG